MGGGLVAVYAVSTGIVIDGVGASVLGGQAGRCRGETARGAEAVVHRADGDGGWGLDQPLRLAVIDPVLLKDGVGGGSVGLGGGGEVHVDVGRIAATAFVQVGGSAVVVATNIIPLEGVVAAGVEGDVGDRPLVVEVLLGVVQVDVFAAGITVQVAFLRHEIVAALVGTERIFFVVVIDGRGKVCDFRGIAVIGDIEVGDITLVGAVAARLLVNQEDEIAV